MSDFEQAMETLRFQIRQARGPVLVPSEMERQLDFLVMAHAAVVAERDINLLAAKYLCTMYLTVTGEPREALMAEAFAAADKVLAETKEAEHASEN